MNYLKIFQFREMNNFVGNICMFIEKNNCLTDIMAVCVYFCMVKDVNEYINWVIDF